VRFPLSLAAWTTLFAAAACASAPEAHAPYCDRLGSIKYGEFMKRLDEVRAIKDDRNASKSQRTAAKHKLSTMFACQKAILSRHGAP